MLFTLMTILCMPDEMMCTNLILRENMKATECQLTLDVGIETVTLPGNPVLGKGQTVMNVKGMTFLCVLQTNGDPA